MLRCEKLVDVLPQQHLVVLKLLTASLVLKKLPQVLLAKLGCKRNELVVVGHFGHQCFQDVDCVAEIPLPSGACIEPLKSLFT